MNDETRNRILIQTADLVAAIAKAVAPLIEKTEQHRGLMGAPVPTPTAREIAAALVTDAESLLKSLPADSVFLGEFHRLVHGVSA